MSGDKSESRRDSDEWIEVTPINRVRTESSVQEYEYSYAQVHVDEVGGIDVDGVTIQRHWNSVRWQYMEKVPVWIEEFGVYAKDGADIHEAEEQAYFALSILAGHGYVSDWSKL